MRTLSLPDLSICLLMSLAMALFSSVLCEAKEDTAQLVFRKSVTSAAETYVYTIKKGDHLLDIVKNELGITKNRFHLIKHYNPAIKNLNLIYPGQKLILPTKSRKVTPPNAGDGVVAPPEPDMKTGVLQPGTGLPPASRLAVMHTVLQRMNSTMSTSGRHVIPIPEVGQITVDCEMMPVIEFDDGSVIFMDFKKQMPENIKKLINKHWNNYIVITANAQDDPLKLLSGAVNASKSYMMKKQARPFIFGQKPVLQFPADWVISGKPSSAKPGYLQALTTIQAENQRLPAAVSAYLATKQAVITEIFNNTVLPALSLTATDLSASPLPRLNTASPKEQILDLLGLLGVTPVTDRDVQIFDAVKDGFNLSIQADMDAIYRNHRVICTSKKLPKQFIDILKGNATEILHLSDTDTPKAAIEKTLAAFSIPYSTIPYMFPVSANRDLAEVKITFPTIRFPANDDTPVYLIDFNMEASLYGLLHDKLGFTIIRY